MLEALRLRTNLKGVLQVDSHTARDMTIMGPLDDNLNDGHSLLSRPKVVPLSQVMLMTTDTTDQVTHSRQGTYCRARVRGCGIIGCESHIHSAEGVITRGKIHGRHSIHRSFPESEKKRDTQKGMDTMRESSVFDTVTSMTVMGCFPATLYRTEATIIWNQAPTTSIEDYV